MLSKFSVKRPVTILMIILMVVLIGAVSFDRLPIDLLPEIEYPIIIVHTSYNGVGPQEIEKLITRPLEEVLTTVDNIDTISSTSSEGSSLVIIQLDFGSDMDFAALEVREKIDLVAGYLPEDASDPMVLKFDPDSLPIMTISVSSEGDLETTQNIAEDIIKPRFERIEGAASAEINGGFSKEIEIILIEEKASGFGIATDYLAQILMVENLNLPGGEVSKGKNDLTVRTIGEFQSIEEIRNLNIPLQRGGTVRLRDIAEVNLANTDRTTIARLNGQETLEISVMKQSGVNTVNVSKEINKELEEIKKDYPGIDIVKVFDQADYINFAIEGVISNAVLGGALAILILYVFLRSIKSTVIISLAIPISVIATFILLYFTGVTLNMMTLGGLALGIGMLVDNSIVVLENIYRHVSEGNKIKEASILGANEVAGAVTASTLTTVGVFLPVIFVQGLTAMIFKELAMTIVLSLVASLAVALTLIPMLTSKLLTGEIKKNKKDNSKINIIQRIYKKTLNWSLKHRFVTVSICVLIFVGSFGSVVTLGTEFFPKTDEGQISINIKLPTGAELNETDLITKEVEQLISGIEEIVYMFPSVGSGGNMSFSGGTSNRASITVMLSRKSDRERSTFDVADEIRKLVKDIPGAEIGVSIASTMSAGGLGGSGITISISGDDIDTLETISDDFKNIISNVAGTREITSSMEEGIPEVQVIVDRNRSSQYGLTSAQIANGVKSTLSGMTATRFKMDGNEIDVVIKGDDIYKKGMANLGMIPISTPMGTTIPLSQVADIVVTRGPVSINRENQTRIVTVNCDVFGRDAKTIESEIDVLLQDYTMPRGYSYSYGGESELIDDAFEDLTFALILAIILVYMILAAQFESLVLPFSIILSIPFALSGGALGLFIIGVPMSVPAIIGFIILVGVVVNNAIVLVDYINTRRKNGEKRLEAIKNAGPIRLRPIMMTALTTILGLLPLSTGIGDGAEMTQPLAISVVGGLALSTVVTLVFVPVMYTIFDDIANFFISRKGDVVK